MGWLQEVAAAFAQLAVDANQPVRFQVGEPWWWVAPDGALCVHDDAAKAAVGGGVPTDAQAGALLATSTAALTMAVKAVAPGAETLLLVYLPTVRGREDALVPAGWAAPAFDVLQLEDYEWVTAGDTSARTRGVAEIEARLGYGADRQHYLGGFVLRPEDDADWQRIADAIERARVRGVAATFVWALPQVIRDGFTWFDEERDVEGFADVSFPIAIGREANVEAATSTAIAGGAGGREQRNAEWAEARLTFDAGPGVRSEGDLGALIAFFRARRGPAQAFRFRDPFDDSSNGMAGEPGPEDQLLGIGDSVRTVFALVKDYGGVTRRIIRPVPGTVRVAVDGVEAGGWTLGEGGTVAFDAPPPSGTNLTAGFRFDVPVRFAEDRLAVNRATFLAGEAMSVPLIEVREG
jgi:uncharacterized protein (TIGR02217 family)